MNLKNATRIAVVAVSLALATNAFAATNTGGLYLGKAASVNGIALKAGNYKVKWEGAGENLTVTILDGKKVLATAPAHMTDLGSKASDNSVVMTGGDDKPVIAEIRFAGSNHALGFSSGDGSKPVGN